MEAGADPPILVVRHGRLDLSPLLTHRFSLDQIEDAYELFATSRTAW